MEVGGTSLGKSTKLKMYKASRVWEDKEKFYLSLLVCYGQSSYLRLKNVQWKIHFVLLIGKSRGSPLKYIFIQRLVLIASALSVKLSLLLRQELGIPINKQYFWTDSKVVLEYIYNNRKKLKIFVAYRIQFIRENADPKKWFYVSTKENLAHDSSRD